MGSKSPPAPPPPAEPLDIIDELSGYEQVKVTGADGKERFVRRALPLSPEQEALKQQYESIVTEQIGIIEELSAPALASNIPEFQPALQAYREQQEQSLEKATKLRTRAEEENLARRGVEAGTSATEQRAILGRDVMSAQQQIGDQTMLFGEQLRNQAIGRSQNLLGVATGRQDVGFTQGLQSLGQVQATQQAQLGAQQNYNSMLFQSQMAKYQADQAGMASILGAAATVGGAALGGSMGAGFGSFLKGGGTTTGTTPAFSGFKLNTSGLK